MFYLAVFDLVGTLKVFWSWFGFGEEMCALMGQVLACILVFALAMLANVITKRWILLWLHDLTQKTETEWDNYLVEHHILERLSHLSPAVILYVAAPVMLPYSKSLQLLLRQLVFLYSVVAIAWVLLGMISAAVTISRKMESTKDKPFESYAQLARGLVWLLAAIIIVSSLLGRSPFAVIGGLGAFTAVLMLIFRDSILGFVASVQIMSLDLVRKGDWIEIPKYKIDGSVIGFSLTTIKVENWDKTISTVPAYTLVSDSFKNWRGMYDVGARRVVRSIAIDIYSIKFLDEALLERLKKIQIIQTYLNQKLEDIAEYNELKKFDMSSLANGQRLTNIGVFRAYLDAYLRRHPKVDQDMACLVRQLAPSSQGICLQLYFFSREIRWDLYEGLTAELFDHIIAVLPEFDLRVYQHPGGTDVHSLAEAQQRAHLPYF